MLTQVLPKKSSALQELLAKAQQFVNTTKTNNDSFKLVSCRRLEDLPGDICELLSIFYSSEHKVDKALGTILNACFSQGRKYFVLPNRELVPLFKSDPNVSGQLELYSAGKNGTAQRAINRAISEGWLEVIKKGSRGHRLFKLTDKCDELFQLLGFNAEDFAEQKAEITAWFKEAPATTGPCFVIRDSEVFEVARPLPADEDFEIDTNSCLPDASQVYAPGLAFENNGRVFISVARVNFGNEMTPKMMMTARLATKEEEEIYSNYKQTRLSALGGDA